MSEGLRSHYSSRRRAVEKAGRARCAAAEAELGRSLTAGERRGEYQRAVRDPRRAKRHCAEALDEGLHDRWRSEAGAAGFEIDAWLARTLRHGPARDDPARGNIASLDRRLAAQRLPLLLRVQAELAAATSTWSRSDAVRAMARALPAVPASADEVRRVVEDLVTDGVLADPATVALAPAEPTPPADLRRRDGRSVYDHHGSPRYSTVATLDREQRVLDVATSGRFAERAVARRSDVEAVLAERDLSDDQAEAVRTMTLRGSSLHCIVGPAGTGKSHTVGAAAEAWRMDGNQVRGLAVSAAAAQVLSTSAGIPTETLAKFLHEHSRRGGPDIGFALRPGSVLVVDEAGMVASVDLARLVEITERAEVKVVLVGDHAQLGAVEAGGLFRLLARDAASELTEVHRFAVPWERAASLGLRARDPEALGAYDDHGRIVGGDREAVVDEAFRRWQAARAEGRSVVVCAGDHTTVDELALRARAHRVALGEVEPDGVAAGAQVVGVGDEVVTTRNDRRLVTGSGHWVRNGDRWTVVDRHDDGGLVVEEMSSRGRLTLPHDYVAADLALAYAVTIHKAQGLTVDRAVLIADRATTAEGLYVGMTRGRGNNTALVVCEEHEAEHGPVVHTTAVEVLEGALHRVSADRAAVEVQAQALDASRSLATLAPRLANLEAWLQRETPPDRSVELRHLESLRADAERYGRPGWFTKEARADRRHLAGLDTALDGLRADQKRRAAWLDDHADTLAVRDDLRAAVAARRGELGREAARTQPEHVIDLIGAPRPTTPGGVGRWAERAAAIEAYREEWDVAPNEVATQPTDATQQARWDDQVRSTVEAARREVDLHRRLAEPKAELARPAGFDRGIDIGF